MITPARIKQIIDAIVPPAKPWKIPQDQFSYPKYQYRKTKSEWTALMNKAEAGDAEAQYEVATMYEFGCKTKNSRVLVQPSKSRTLKWTRIAAENGFDCAQNSYGNYLSRDHKNVKQMKEAFEWYRKAYKQDQPTGVAGNIAITYRDITDYRSAVLWFRKSVREYDGDAYVDLAIHQYWGIGMRSNPTAAVVNLRKAVKSKFITEFSRDKAYFYLAIAFLEGRGVKQSINTAIKNLKRADKDKDNLAAYRLLKKLAPSA